jgi:hypothetical protein
MVGLLHMKLVELFNSKMDKQVTIDNGSVFAIEGQADKVIIEFRAEAEQYGNSSYLRDLENAAKVEHGIMLDSSYKMWEITFSTRKYN